MNLRVTFKQLLPDEIFAGANRVEFGKKRTRFYLKKKGEKRVFMGSVRTKNILVITPEEV